MLLGIEIGGTKLQLALGQADGHLHASWRSTIAPELGAAGILAQLRTQIPKFCGDHNLDFRKLQAIGIGFGGPVDIATGNVIVSHQVGGWEHFTLIEWVQQHFEVPASLGNDADVAGLAEATIGAGRGCESVFYITMGSGVGGGYVLQQKLVAGTGRGAAEIGHLQVLDPRYDDCRESTIEGIASGWGIQRYLREQVKRDPMAGNCLLLLAGTPEQLDTKILAQALTQSDPFAWQLWKKTLQGFCKGICTVIALLCPHRIVIGGGVSLLGEELLFAPLRVVVDKTVFPPFRGLTEIVPAHLGEEVVLHGALELASQVRSAA
ncbi:MAG: ROK family protein [Zavarzinella sp.]